MFAESVMSSHHTHGIADNRYSIYHRVGDGDTHKSGELTVICKFVSKETGLDGSDSVYLRTGQSSRGGGGGEGTVSLSIDITRSDICKIGCWKCACLQLPEKVAVAKAASFTRPIDTKLIY